MPEEAPTIAVDKMQAAIDAAFKHDTKEPIIQQQQKEVVVTKDEPVKTEVKPEVKAEPKADEGEPIPKEFEGKDWAKNLNKSHREAVSKLKTLETQLADFEGTRKERDELKARVTEMEAKVTEYKQGQSASALERDPDFRKKYVDGRNSQVEKLKSLASAGDIDGDALMAALSKTDPKERLRALDDVVQDAPRILQTKLVSVIDQIETLDEQRNAELRDADEAFSRRETERTQRERQVGEQRSKAALEAWQEAAKDAEKYGLDSKAVQEAEEFFKSNKDISKAAQAVVKAKAADVLMAKLEELESELAEFRKASPGIKSGVDAGGKAVDPNMSVKDMILQTYHSNR